MVSVRFSRHRRLLPDYILEKICLKLFLEILFSKFRMCFFKAKHYWPYLRNGWCDWQETKRRCVVCDWVNYVTWPLISPMTHTFSFSKSNFEMAVSQELLVWLMWKEREAIFLYWSDCNVMTSPFDQSLWPWPWRFKVKVWNSLISGMGGPTDMERKRCELSIVGGCTG